MMFIDEGFGSLDEHSRDQAVRVLKDMACWFQADRDYFSCNRAEAGNGRPADRNKR